MKKRKNVKKRILPVLLALCMLMALLPGTALAADDVAYAVEGGNIWFDKSTGTITDCDGSVTKAVIPSKIDGVDVTSIRGYAFSHCDSLSSVTIPDSVIYIGKCAFSYCTSLSSIIVESNNNYYSSQDGVLFNKEMTQLYCYPEGKADSSYSIPDSVTLIGWYAFENCKSLSSITISDGVQWIYDSAFANCDNLTSVTIPGMTSGGVRAFLECDNLTSVTIQHGVASIGDEEFDECKSLSSITIPDSVTSIGVGAFRKCDSLSDVYYSGSQEQWRDIDIKDNNDPLLKANIHYNSTGPEQEPTTPVKGVTLSPETITLTVGATTELTAEIQPDNATNKELSWSSSAPLIADVDNDGVVTAVSAGSAVITVTTADGGYTAECKVTVAEAVAPATYTVTLNANGGTVSAKTLTTDENGKLNALPTPTREGFTFDGWYTDAEGGTRVTTETVFNSDATIYAHWTENTTDPVDPTPPTEQDPVKPEEIFNDVETGDWFYDDVAFVVEKGLMNGTGDNKFSPVTQMSRAMLVTVLYRLDGEHAVSGGTVFTDVENGTWYTNAVAWASANGIVDGYGNGRFGPDDNITREQIATILYRYAKYKGYNVSQTADLSKYTDAGQITSWALEAMEYANAAGLITGRTDTTIAPVENAQRSEVAAVIHRFCDNIMK